MATLGVVIAAIIILATLLYLVPMLTGPKPIVTFANAYDTFEGLDYIVVVEATVKNNGNDGWVNVYADLSLAGKYEMKSDKIYLSKGESKYTWFKFDVSFWESLIGGLIDPNTLKMSYRVWAESA